MIEGLPQHELTARIARVQSALQAQGWDGLLATQNTDIYYLTGSMQSGYVYVPAAGDPTFYVRRSVTRAQRESHVRTVELGSFRSFGATLAADYPQLDASTNAKPQIASPLDTLPAQTYLKLAELLSGCQTVIVDGSAMMRTTRMIKSSWELDRISAAAQAAAEALEAALPQLREGVSELDWLAAYEYEIRRRGHIGVMRMRAYNQEVLTGMVGSGEAAAEPTYFDGPAGGRGLGPFAPQSASRKRFARNEPILIDIGCCIDGYIIDQTRTAVIGELSQPLRDAYAVAERIMRRTEQLLVPGTPAELLYEEALRMATDAGLKEHFMGFGADQVRFLGHGIGLEVDEWPVLAKGVRTPLEPGMVIAIEPKFTFPGIGVVGIENTYAIAEHSGPSPLTQSPEQLIVVPLA